jgi:hypothetical protein
MINQNEIYSHGLIVSQDEDESEVIVISGKDWDNVPFKLFVHPNEVDSLLVQLSFYTN